jgi:hypothetical protein
MANIADPLVVCQPLLLIYILYILLDYTVKDIIWGYIIGYNSSKLQLNTIILKDREKDRELVISAMARYLF